MNTTTTTLNTLIIIKGTNESLIFNSPKDAVEHLVKFGHLPIDKLTGNPLFILGEAMKKGIIEAKFNQDPEERPALKMEIKAEPPKVKQLTIEGRPEPKPIPNGRNLEIKPLTEEQIQGCNEIIPGATWLEIKEAPEVKPEPRPTPKPEPVKAEANPDKAAQFLALMGELITPQQASINLEQVREVIREELSKQEPTRITHEIKILEQVKPIGAAHYLVPEICQLLAIGENVYLYGPSGSGKSHAAKQAAELLNIDFFSLSICSQTTKTEILGYTGPNGQYIETDFYKAYKNGGLFLLDEVDNGNPNILTLLNSAISNGFCSFPCGQVQQHENFKIIAGANTIGNGGNIQYVGRNPLDGATKARFTFVEFPYDEKLETELSPVKEFCKKVQALRAKANKLGIKAIITPRDSIRGGQMIQAGMSEETALNYRIYNKLSQDEAKLLKA